MRLEVVIPAARWSGELKSLLQSIANQALIDKLFVQVHLIIDSQLSFSQRRELMELPLSIRVSQGVTQSLEEARELGFSQSQSDILLFLDSDCLLPGRNYFESLLKSHADNSASVLGGFYISKKNQSIWQKAYNRMVKVWLQQNRCQHGRFDVLVAGCLSFKRQQMKTPQLSFQPFSDCGGEELHLATQLRSAVAESHLISDLCVYHYPNGGVRHFFSRARSQGEAYANFCNSKFFPSLKGLKELVLLLRSPIIFFLVASFLLVNRFYFLKSAIFHRVGRDWGRSRSSQRGKKYSKSFA